MKLPINQTLRKQISSGGFGVTIGKQMQSTDQKAVSTAVAASTVGSTLGDVLIRAGQRYTQVGSDLLTPAGNVDVEAQSLLVKDARATARVDTETKFRQAGLMIGVSGGVISAIESAQQLKEASENTSSGRMQALAGATAALQGKSAYDGVQNAVSQGNPVSGMSVGVSIGASSSSSKRTETSDNAIGSQIVAGGTGRFVATGAGAASDLTIQGSTVQLGGGGTIASDGTLNLVAAENRSTLKSSNKSAGGSIGIGYTAGQGLGITLSVNMAKGRADGSDLTYTNTRIESGGVLDVRSGGDVLLKGGVITAENVTGNIGGNLNIESLQDKSEYESKQTSAGFSYTYGAGGASASFGKSNVDSNYVSVTEQSGIHAGDGGFQLTVAGNTDLKGAVITSTQAAMDAGKNAFSTASLTMSDMENRAEYQAKSTGFSGGTAGGGSAGFGKDSGNESSFTRAGISGYAGDTAVRTGDVQSGIPKIFDVDKVQREIDAQVTITRAFGQVAPKAVADFADRATKRHTEAKLAKDEIDRQLANESDPVRRTELEQARDQVNEIVVQTQGDYDKWREGGIYRVALHTALGGLAGGYTGALGAGVVSTAAPGLDALQDRLQGSLVNAGLQGKTASGIARFITGATAAGLGGALTGGDIAGAGQAFNVDSNNRQLHEEEIARIKRLSKDFAEQQGISEEEATQRLAQQALRQVDFVHRARLSDGDDVAAQAFLKTDQTFTNDLGEQQQLFTATGQQLLRPEMYADTADPAFYARYVQPGVTRDLRSGLLKEVKDLGVDFKDGVVSAAKAASENPGQAARELGKAIIGIPGAIYDGVVESGHAIGEGAAVAFDDDLSNKLNTIYGTDVDGVQGTLLTLRTVTAVAGGAAAKKVLTHTGETITEGVKKQIESKELEKAKDKEIADLNEKLNFEKDSFEVESGPPPMATTRTFDPQPDELLAGKERPARDLTSVAFVSGDSGEISRKARSAAAGDLSAKGEIDSAKALRDAGINVHFQTAAGDLGIQGVRTADFIVGGAARTGEGGVAFDVLTPTTPNAGRVAGQIAKKLSQTDRVIINLDNTTLAADSLSNIVPRVNGIPSISRPLQEVIIVRDGKVVARHGR